MNFKLSVLACLLIGACSECISEPKLFRAEYKWTNGINSTRTVVYDEGHDFNPRWFPMASATDVFVSIDIESKEVRFVYQYETTQVTEVWEMSEYYLGELRRDECVDED